MKLHEFLEAVYVQQNIKNQINYTPFGDAYCKSASSLVDAQRRVLKWAAYVVVLGQYLAVLLHLVKAPANAHDQIETLKASTALHQADLAKLAADARAQAIQSQIASQQAPSASNEVSNG